MTTASGHRTSAQIFLAPALIAIVTALGLVSALLGDDIWDALSWIALLLPAAVVVWFGLLKR